ncbi:unnamed protein product [Closterium sp. NIES-54]
MRQALSRLETRLTLSATASQHQLCVADGGGRGGGRGGRGGGGREGGGGGGVLRDRGSGLGVGGRGVRKGWRTKEEAAWGKEGGSAAGVMDGGKEVERGHKGRALSEV